VEVRRSLERPEEATPRLPEFALRPRRRTELNGDREHTGSEHFINLFRPRYAFSVPDFLYTFSECLTVYRSKVTSVQKRIEPQKPLAGAAVAPTEAGSKL